MVYRKERLDVEVIRARGLVGKQGNKNTPGNKLHTILHTKLHSHTNKHTAVTLGSAVRQQGSAVRQQYNAVRQSDQVSVVLLSFLVYFSLIASFCLSFRVNANRNHLN